MRCIYKLPAKKLEFSSLCRWPFELNSIKKFPKNLFKVYNKSMEKNIEILLTHPQPDAVQRDFERTGRFNLVVTASSSKEAQLKAFQWSPHLIIYWDSPQYSEDFLQLRLKDPNLMSIPVLIITEAPSKIKVLKWKKCHVQGIIVWPLSMLNILQKINGILSKFPIPSHKEEIPCELSYETLLTGLNEYSIKIKSPHSITNKVVRISSDLLKEFSLNYCKNQLIGPLEDNSYLIIFRGIVEEEAKNIRQFPLRDSHV